MAWEWEGSYLFQTDKRSKSSIVKEETTGFWGAFKISRRTRINGVNGG